MLPCLRQSPSHLVTEWLHGPFPSWRGQTPHSPWSVNTLWIPSWLILLWPVRPSVNSQMSYSPMASPRVFTAPDQGNDFTAKGIHQWTQAHGINPHHLETVGLSVRRWCGGVKQYSHWVGIEDCHLALLGSLCHWTEMREKAWFFHLRWLMSIIRELFE